MDNAVHVNGYSISMTTIRFLGQVVVTVFMVSAAYWGLKSQVSDLGIHVSNSDKRIDGNTEQMRQMDANGTRRSHEIDYGQQQQIDGILKTLEKHDKTLVDVVGKLDRVDTNVLWMMGRMKQDGRP